MWAKRKPHKAVNSVSEKYSLIDELISEKRIDEKTLTQIGQLSLEEVIGLKLEMATRIAGGYLYGFPIYKRIGMVIRHAILAYALSATRTVPDAAAFLQIDEAYFRKKIINFGLLNKNTDGEKQDDQ